MFSAVKEVLSNAADASFHLLGIHEDGSNAEAKVQTKSADEKVEPGESVDNDSQAPLSPARIKISKRASAPPSPVSLVSTQPEPEIDSDPDTALPKAKAEPKSEPKAESKSERKSHNVKGPNDIDPNDDFSFAKWQNKK